MFSFIGFGIGRKRRTKKAQKTPRSRKDDDPFSRVSWSFVTPEEYAPWDRAIDRAASSTAVDIRSQGNDSLSYTSKKPLPDMPMDRRDSFSESLPAPLPRSRSGSTSEASVAHFASRSISRHTLSSSRSSHAFEAVSLEDHSKSSPKLRVKKTLPPIVIPSPLKHSFRRKSSETSDVPAPKSRASIAWKGHRAVPITATDSEKGTSSPLSGINYPLDALPTFDIGKPGSVRHLSPDRTRMDSATLPNEKDCAILYQKSLLASDAGSVSSRKMALSQSPTVDEYPQTGKSDSTTSSPKKPGKAITKPKSSLMSNTQLTVGQTRFPASRVSRITEASSISISELTLSNRVSADKVSSKIDRTIDILKWRESTSVEFEDSEEIVEVPTYRKPGGIAPDDRGYPQSLREIVVVESDLSKAKEPADPIVYSGTGGLDTTISLRSHQKAEPRVLGIPESATFSSTGTLSMLLAQLDPSALEFPALQEAFGLGSSDQVDRRHPLSSVGGSNEVLPRDEDYAINKDLPVVKRCDDEFPPLTENEHRKHYPSIELFNCEPEQQLSLLHNTDDSKLSDKTSHHRSFSLPEIRYGSSLRRGLSGSPSADDSFSVDQPKVLIHESLSEPQVGGAQRHVLGRKRSGSAPIPIQIVENNHITSLPTLIVTPMPEVLEREYEVLDFAERDVKTRNTRQTVPETPSAFSPLMSPPLTGPSVTAKNKLPLRLFIPLEQHTSSQHKRFSVSPLISPLVPPSPKLFTPSPTDTTARSLRAEVSPLKLRPSRKSHRRPRGPRVRRRESTSDPSTASGSSYYIINPPKITKWRSEGPAALDLEGQKAIHIHDLIDRLQERPMFSTSPVQWRGFKHDSAKLKFTQSELQDITSRAIKQSSDISSIRLLPLDVLDKELPDDLHRLEERKQDVISEYTKEVRHRKNLLRSLFTLVSSGSPLREIEIQIHQRVYDIARSSTYCDDLTDELHDVMDKLMQIQRLQDRHYSSSLAVALRKLHSSFLRQFAELHVLQKYVEELEMWRDAALSQTEQITRELDSFNDRTGPAPSKTRSPTISFISKRSSFRSQSNHRASQRYTARSSASSLHVNVSTGTRSTFFGSGALVPPVDTKAVWSLGQDESSRDDCSFLLSNLRTAFLDTEESRRLEDELLEMLGLEDSVPSRPQSLIIG